MDATYGIVLIIQAILAGVFGSIIGELASKCKYDKVNFKKWKVYVIGVIFIITIFTNSWLTYTVTSETVYNTKDYTIENLETIFDHSDSTEVTTFKIIKK